MNLLLIIAIFWVGFELILSFLLRSNKSNSVSHDNNSILIIWLVISISVSLAIYSAFHFPQAAVYQSIIGVSLILGGMLLRIFAMLGLKNRFTTNIAISEDHLLKTDGLYSVLRHPSYTGSLISFAGLGLALGNLPSLLILMLPITSVFIFRITLEERMLLKHFGKEYHDYMKKTSRLLPFIY